MHHRQVSRQKFSCSLAEPVIPGVVLGPAPQQVGEGLLDVGLGDGLLDGVGTIADVGWEGLPK
jgi:hypothetical protein